MNAKDSVGYKKDVDYDTKHVRSGPEGGTAPEFKCFNCDVWFDGNEWRYTLSKAWYPFLKYKINFYARRNALRRFLKSIRKNTQDLSEQSGLEEKKTQGEAQGWI